MREFPIKFTATDEVVQLTFSTTPRLSDVFVYRDTYFMVVDYDGNYVHVVAVNKLEILEGRGDLID